MNHWENWQVWPKDSYWVVIVKAADGLVEWAEAVCEKYECEWAELVQENKNSWN